MKEDTDSMWTRIDQIENDVQMLMDDTIALDDKVVDIDKKGVEKRDELLAQITELKDTIESTGAKISTYATAASALQNGAGKRKIQDIPEEMAGTKKVKMDKGLSKETMAQPAKFLGNVPQDYNGRKADTDMLVWLNDPLDPLSMMFPWMVKYNGHEFPCIALAIMMAEAKSLGSTEMENAVLACVPFFVKHTGIDFDEKYYDFSGKLYGAWSKLWTYECAQGDSISSLWFNTGGGKAFEMLYDSVEAAKQTPAYKALVMIIGSAVMKNPQLRQLLWQTGKEKTGNTVVDNFRFIRCTGSFPNSGWRGALMCGMDKSATEVSLATCVGVNFKSPFMSLWGEALMEVRAKISTQLAYRKRNDNGVWVQLKEYGTFVEYDVKGIWKVTDPTGINRRIAFMMRGRGRGRGGNFNRGRGRGDMLNSANNGMQSGARGGYGRNRGSNRGFGGRNSVTVTPGSNTLISAKFDGATEPEMDGIEELNKEAEKIYSVARACPEVLNGETDLAALNARLTEIMNIVHGKTVAASKPVVTPAIDDDLANLITPTGGTFEETEMFDEGTFFDEDMQFDSPEAPTNPEALSTAAPEQASAAPAVAFTHDQDQRPPPLSQVEKTRKRRAELMHRSKPVQRSITSFMARQD